LGANTTSVESSLQGFKSNEFDASPVSSNGIKDLKKQLIPSLVMKCKSNMHPFVLEKKGMELFK
jgi:hypothetical protein